MHGSLTFSKTCIQIPASVPSITVCISTNLAAVDDENTSPLTPLFRSGTTRTKMDKHIHCRVAYNLYITKLVAPRDMPLLRPKQQPITGTGQSILVVVVFRDRLSYRCSGHLQVRTCLSRPKHQNARILPRQAETGLIYWSCGVSRQ